MEREAWRPWLKRWSEEWISARESRDGPPLDPDVVREGWLGFGPAAPDAIAGLERRLGSALPPSLRGFLEVTDGWRNAGDFIYRLGGTAEIGFLRDMDSMWIDAYGRPFDDDDEYSAEIGRMMRRSVQISLAGDASVLFLDPGDVGPDGEWAAYRLASWSGEGPERHDSFHDLMYRLYASFHALNRPGGETRSNWDARVETARLAALAGEIDEPLQVFDEAERFGSDRATLLAVQMRTLLRTGGGRRLSHLLSPAGEPAWIIEDPVFERELLPLLFAEQRNSHRGSATTLEFLMGHHGEPGPLQLAIADHQARVREPGHRQRFGGEDFDRAIRTVLDGLSPDQDLDRAWPAVRDALRLWRPVSEHHIAPVVLLADPLLAKMIDRERGREILAMPRGAH